jgi:hypothetical protein
MRVIRIAMLALLVGIVAGTANGQIQPYGDRPDTQDQEYGDWRQPDNDYDRDHGPDLDVGFFYHELSPYGEWVRHPRYGWVWFPRHVRANWRPYSLGRWVGSDYGWMWVSNERFGWATYHYGRWAWDPYVGWLWVPGTNWGPAWVAWQHGNGYIGWAPLPPEVGFEGGVGIRLGGFSLSLGISPRNFVFVEERRFLRSSIGSYFMPTARNTAIINHTRNITHYSMVGNRVINHGVSIERIEQATGTRAPRLRVATAPSPQSGGVQRDVVSIYRPTASKLETVRVAPRNNAGLPQTAPVTSRPEARPPTARPPAVVPIRQRIAPVPIPIPVAPRTKLVPRETSETKFLREQKALKSAQDREQRVLDQIHRKEIAQDKTKANALEVVQRHAAELQVQQELRQRAELQLQTRQQIERQAAQVSAAHIQKLRETQAAPGGPKKEKKDKRQKP